MVFKNRKALSILKGKAVVNVLDMEENNLIEKKVFKQQCDGEEKNKEPKSIGDLFIDKEEQSFKGLLFERDMEKD